ncbi:hypothetical protein KAZ57_02495 [Patescibacteria group bacterium]|nr:hypothetical protein [Patescibacteria group bacterium]
MGYKPKANEVLYYSRTGGFAGVCDELFIFSNNSYELTNCRQEAANKTGYLTQDESAEFQKLIKNKGRVIKKWDDAQAGITDGFIEEIHFFGTGNDNKDNADQTTEFAKRILEKTIIK